MVKVIYDKSPLNNSKRIVKEYDSDKSLEEILDDLGILSDCSLEVNGVIPDYVSLDRKFEDGDLVRLRKPLHGSSEESGKLVQTIGTIVGIVVSLIPGAQAVGAAIIAASNLVGGLIIANGVKPPKLQERSEGEQAAQVFNLTASQNEVRKLEPMNLVLGCHRLSPDFGSQPYSKYVGGGAVQPQTATATENLVITKNFGGPTLPAKWIAQNIFNQFDFSQVLPSQPANWWDYPLQTLPSFNTTNYINASRQELVAGANLTQWDYVNFNPTLNTSYITPTGTVTGRGPTLIRHFAANDPIVVSNGGQPFVSTLELLQWVVYAQFKMDPIGPGTQPVFTNLNQNTATSASTGNGVPGNFVEMYRYLLGFNGSNSANPQDADQTEGGLLGLSLSQYAVYRNLYANKDFTSPDNNIQFWLQGEGPNVNTQFSTTESDFYDPPMDFVFGDWLSQSFTQRKQTVEDFIAGLNNPQTDLVAPVSVLKSFNTLSDPRTQEVSHIMHYGFGDLTISDRRIGDTDFNDIFGSINTLNTETATAWPLDQINYHSNVKVVDGAQLLNEKDGNFTGPTSLESLNVNVQSNWITRETPDNTYRICINIEGRSFESLDNGDFDLLGANFEIQYRDVTAGWTTYQPLETAYFLGSNKADPIRDTYDRTLPPSRYEIRIRKRTLDPTDANKIQEFNITSFNFFVVDDNPYTAENREGIKLQATGSFNGTTQRYNNFVEMKAWVFKPEEIVPGGGPFNDNPFDTVIPARWDWEKTRNPAWLFLYYARGGFLNPSADGSFAHPFSPTVGWVNSADQPDNTERLFGAGLSDEDIDIEKIIEWAQFCDDNDLRGDLIVRSDTSAHDVLQRIANTGRASVSYYCSQLSIVYEDPNEPVTGMFGMSNILKGSFSINYAVEDVPYKVVGKYTDRDDEWKTLAVEAIVPNSIPDNLNIEEIVLDGITERDRAQREVNIIAARQAYQRRTYNWTTAVEGVTVRRGDKVYLSHDVTCYDQSGRLIVASIVNGQVTELETPICLGTTTDIMLRFLDGTISTFKATNQGNKLILETPIDASLFPETIDQEGTQNNASLYPGSVIDDIVFFAGPKATPGKAVRVTAVEPQEGLNRFRISAVEEDPVIWAFEFDNTAEPEETSFERVQASIKSAEYEKLDENKYKISWEIDGAHGAIVQQSVGGTTTTLQAEGQYTQFRDCAIFEFLPDGVYNLEIVPIVFGEVYSTKTYKLTIRT